MSEHARDGWRMEFRDIRPNIVEALFWDVHLHDVEDVDHWCALVRGHFEHRSDKVYLLIDLSGLHVRPGASRYFGEVRASLLGEIAHHSVRYGADRWTSTSIHTSRVLHGADANLFESREDALTTLVALASEHDG